ncbi:MAG: lipoprotein-releasing ABC transporter permease subunit [Alphaproteobacteria bacterium]|nr:lipoprotein-releasing ABC transporter permease subunit [Alphaproteobacteria bacterium]MDA7988088.1 lipoprotein-releasing ABC transporter permease subunit [Alphaproteobacteria bacterium]MDA8009620.1 lipoprotein-releasing ABC transporter permease subunit [Alphaproteobacteria bacterium]
MNWIEPYLARRYLTARGGGFISVIAIFSFLGILLGVATLIVVMAVMNGFRNDLISRILGFNGHITAFPRDGYIEYTPELGARLRETLGTDLFFPMVQESLLGSHSGRVFGVGVRALRPEDIARRDELSGSIDGDELARFGNGGILLGERLAERYGLSAGSMITLLNPDGNQTVLGTLPRQGSFEVAGTFSLGFNDYDSNFIIMPLETAQRFFRAQGQINAIEVFGGDPGDTARLGEALRAALSDDWRFVDWQEANSTFLSALTVERNVMFLILSLIILVAAFNIVSGQYMLVNDKAREIAILRTMGMSRGQAQRVFIISGGLIGVTGVFGGWGLGVLITDNIRVIQGWIEALSGAEVFSPEVYYLTRLPAERDTLEVLFVVVLALLVSILAPVWPARRAAGLDPVEILRND